MKRLLAVLLVLVLLVPMAAALATEDDKPELSRNNRFPVGMVLYAKPRVEANGANAKNLTGNGFSAIAIEHNQGVNNYGLYFKFTPRASIQASRIDFYIHVPQPGDDYQMGWWGEMDLPRNYYRYWEFLSLQDMFDEQISKNGQVIPGTYTMDLYLDYQYAGQVQFKVNR